MDTHDMSERLATFMARHVGQAVTIKNLQRMAGGASREIWALDATYEVNGVPVSVPLVMRRASPTALTGIPQVHEVELLRAARAHGVPVPCVHWFAEDGDTLGAPFFLMDRIAGETIPRRLLRDPEYAEARQHMTAQLAGALAAIHRIDARAHHLDFLSAPGPGESPAQNELDRYEQIFRAISPDPHPAFELAIRWLRRHLPSGGKSVVVHGDFRIGNVIFGPEGLRAVLDWELAHLGDPMEDLGWLCVRSWRFGNDAEPVGGIGRREALFLAYEEAGGGHVDAGRVRFWEVLGNLKWGIMTIMQAKTHLDGHRKSVELASLGRRTAEMELELLNLTAGGCEEAG
jgi:aminoglycoside phosphotransferase (APT) family kinase protein